MVQDIIIKNSTQGDVAGVSDNSLKVAINSPLESNGAVPVNIQDQTTKPIDTYFLRSLSNFTLSADTTKSSTSTLSYDFTATAGHGINSGDEILLLDTVGDEEFYAQVTNVATNTITVDRPIDHVFPSATALGRIVSSDMAVDGSSTPAIFTVRAGTNPIDLTRVIIYIQDTASMDDGKFGGINALSNGLVFRIVDGTQKTIFNFKSNGEIKQYCYDGSYVDATLGPGGAETFSARITFGGQSKHGVVLRVSGTDALQWIVQDNLTGLDKLQIVAQGHEVTD